MTSGKGCEAPPLDLGGSAGRADQTYQAYNRDRSGAKRVYHQFRFLESALSALRGAFSREAPFAWLRVFVLGMICRCDALGVSSAVRALRLEPQAYGSLLELFRSSAWSAESLRRRWYAWLARLPMLLEYAGRPVLCSDGCKVSKEGTRMPGVRRLHQESATSSKGETIFGHMFGAVGVLCGTVGHCLCVPMRVNLHDGMRAAAGWDGAAGAGVSPESHVVQSVRCAFEAARGLGRRCILTMDRYFLAVPALRLQAELNELAEADGLGAGLVHIVTKAKSSSTCWMEPPARRPGTRGRPRKRGARVRLALVAGAMDYEPVSARVGGARRELEAATYDLLWGHGLYARVRVVAVRGLGPKVQFLVSTDRTLSAAQIIECYSLRWQIEVSFRDMKQEVGGFGYRFWSKAMPELDRFARSGGPDRLESVSGEAERAAILASAAAIDRFVAASCVALGLLQVLALAEPTGGEVAYAEFSRTPKAKAVSVGAMRAWLRGGVSGFILGDHASRMAAFIRERLVGEGGYAPEARRRGRRRGR